MLHGWYAWEKSRAGMRFKGIDCTYLSFERNELRLSMKEMEFPDLTPEEAIFFAGKPEELALYETFRSRVLTEVGEAHIKMSKTQITFSGKYGFAFVSHPRRKKDVGILVSFGLFHRQESDRIQYASESYPNRWTRHMLVQRHEEIDDELMGWIKEAYWFSEQK